MMKPLHHDPNRRHDFMILFEVSDGNPNGDPDAGNLPRVDPETMQGLVTDVAIKRKIRDYVDTVYGTEEKYKIYVQNKGIALNTLHRRAYDSLDLKSTGAKQQREDVDRARQWMCANFYDIRMFGAVMTTAVNAGQVRGPVQLTFGRSIDPIIPLDCTITRVAVTKEEDAKVVVGETEGDKTEGGKVTEMGRKAVVPYALYTMKGFYNHNFAAQTGVDEQDLAILWEALQNLWDHDRSASRGMLVCRGLVIFTHGYPQGSAPAHRLLEAVSVSNVASPPRRFSDYVLHDIPDSITVGDRSVRLVPSNGDVTLTDSSVLVTKLIWG